MGDTGMVKGSGTQGYFAGEERKVNLCCGAKESVATDYKSKHGQVYAVRLKNGDDRVLLQIDTGRLAERAKIKAANDSVRRRTRG